MYTVYSKENCPACSRAKALLQSRGLEYKEYIIGKDVMREHVLELFPDMKSVPIIIENGELVGGYEQLNERIINEGRQFLTETSSN
jgi:glutaredoxin